MAGTVRTVAAFRELYLFMQVILLLHCLYWGLKLKPAFSQIKYGGQTDVVSHRSLLKCWEIISTADMWEWRPGRTVLSAVPLGWEQTLFCASSSTLHCPPVALQHGETQTSAGWHRNVDVSSSGTSCLPATCLVNLTACVMGSVWPRLLKPSVCYTARQAVGDKQLRKSQRLFQAKTKYICNECSANTGKLTGSYT